MLIYITTVLFGLQVFFYFYCNFFLIGVILFSVVPPPEKVFTGVLGYGVAVLKEGITGFVVPKRDIHATADAIQKFIDNPNLRQEMGSKGRERVLELYDWEKNVMTMIGIYKDILK